MTRLIQLLNILFSIFFTTIVSIVLIHGTCCAAAAAAAAAEEEEESLEALFRQTISQWRAAVAASSMTSSSSRSSSNYQWQQTQWQPWMAFAAQLEKLVQQQDDQQQQQQQPQPQPNDDIDDIDITTSNNKNRNNKLDIIGAYEEGILAIERDIHQQRQRQRPHGSERLQHREDREDAAQRDAALSQLYTGYAQLLTRLSSDECRQLALDPHTLLIGANTVTKNSKNSSPSLARALCLENADNSARNAISLNDNNVQAHKLLQSILVLLVKNASTSDEQDDQDSGSSRGPRNRKTEFVAELFDSFADSFDETLVDNLQYKVPELVGDWAKQLLAGKIQKKQHGADNVHSNYHFHYYYQAVLDAGCGTGLAGRHLRPLIADADHGGIMIGVDASRKMLEKAAAAQCARKGLTSTGCGGFLPNDNNNNNNEEQEQHDNNRPLYDKLLQMDLQDMTIYNTIGTIVDVVDDKKRSGNNMNNNYNTTGFDLVVAADVLVYFGNLDRIIRTFASVSRRGAMLIFSTEKIMTTNDNDNDDKNDDIGATAGAATKATASSSLPPRAGGWRLQSSGRFAHTKQHAVDVAERHGYKLVSYQEIVPRMEKGEPVQGQLFAFVLLDDDDDDSGMGDDMHGGEL